MAALTEDIIKSILKQEGMPVPLHFITDNLEGLDQYHNLHKNVVVKPAVPVGRRGKAGAIEFVSDKKELIASFERLIKKSIYGFEVQKVLVEERIDIARELFLSFSFNRSLKGLLMMVSPDGGVEVEKTIRDNPEKLLRLEIDPCWGLQLHDAVEVWSKAGINEKLLVAISGFAQRLYNIFVKYDFTLLEINPLCVSRDGKLIAVGAMGEIDDDALYRHAEIFEQHGRDLKKYSLAGMTSLEQQVAMANYTTEGTGTVRYREIPSGDIALLTGGAGAGLVTVDSILKFGGKPANYSDVGAGAVEERLRVLLRTILSKPGIKGLLVAFSILNMGRADLVASLVKSVLLEMKVDPEQFPVVIRLAGYREEQAREELAGVQGVRFYGDDVTLEEAAKIMVDLVGGAVN